MTLSTNWGAVGLIAMIAGAFVLLALNAGRERKQRR
mgnify:CR=1 FL=1